VATGAGKQVVLVVDDEPAIRFLCRVNLELAGYVVREAGTLAEGRRQLAAGDLDVALVDMHLGSELSDELLRELKQAGVAVAVVTGSVEAGSAGEAVADAVLRKPFTIEQLESTVTALAAR
jgi:two-component system catabolic regulation response regulator CreB